MEFMARGRPTCAGAAKSDATSLKEDLRKAEGGDGPVCGREPSSDFFRRTHGTLSDAMLLGGLATKQVGVSGLWLWLD